MIGVKNKPALSTPKWYTKGMSLFLRQDQERSQLQRRIATELQAKARQQATDAEQPDGVEDSAFVADTHRSSRRLGLWLTLAAIVIGGVIWTVVVASTSSGGGL